MTARQALYGYELAHTARSQMEGIENDAPGPFPLRFDFVEDKNAWSVEKILEWHDLFGFRPVLADGYIVGE